MFFSGLSELEMKEMEQETINGAGQPIPVPSSLLGQQPSSAASGVTTNMLSA
jgi:hypothetical protein